MSLIVVGGIGFLPIYFCRASTLYTKEELQDVSGESWLTIYGKVYEVGEYRTSHPGGMEAIDALIGNDATAMFPRTPPMSLPAFCLVTTKITYFENHQIPVCSDLTTEDYSRGAICHPYLVGKRNVDNKFHRYKKGDVVIPDWELGKDGMQWIRIENDIYNVTQYVDGLRHNRTNLVIEDPSHPNAYLLEALHLMVVHKLNQDATQVYRDLFPTDDHKL